MRIDAAAQRVPGGRRRARRRPARCDTPHARGRACGGVLRRTRSGACDPSTQRREIDVDDAVRAARARSARVSASSSPRSAISPWPSQARSAVDSPKPGRAVELHREVLRRRHAHQIAAVLPLADGDVRRRQVGEHGGAGERRERARRHRHPEVLADLGVQDEARRCAAASTRTSVPNGTPSPSSSIAVAARRGARAGTSAARRTRGSSGGYAFGATASGAAAVERDRAVVERAVDGERSADGDQRGPSRASRLREAPRARPARRASSGSWKKRSPQV